MRHTHTRAQIPSPLPIRKSPPTHPLRRVRRHKAATAGVVPHLLLQLLQSFSLCVFQFFALGLLGIDGDAGARAGLCAVGRTARSFTRVLLLSPFRAPDDRKYDVKYRSFFCRVFVIDA